MLKQKPFPFSLLVLFVLILLHLVGSYYSWYWVYSWFDVVVHILSGLWVASVFLWLASYLGEINSMKEYKVKSFLIAFVSGLLVGVVWELLENFSQITFINHAGYGLDTAFDLINGALGAILAYLYFVKKKKSAVPHLDTLHPFYNQIRSN